MSYVQGTQFLVYYIFRFTHIQTKSIFHSIENTHELYIELYRWFTCVRAILCIYNKSNDTVPIFIFLSRAFFTLCRVQMCYCHGINVIYLFLTKVKPLVHRSRQREIIIGETVHKPSCKYITHSPLLQAQVSL